MAYAAGRSDRVRKGLLVNDAENINVKYCIDQIGKIKTYVQEIASAFWGDDKLRDNGVRSIVREHDTRLDALQEDQRQLREEMRHYLDKGREDSCLGLAEFKRRDEARAEEEGEDATVKAAEIQSIGAVQAAKWQARAQIAVEVLTLAGILFLALR